MIRYFIPILVCLTLVVNGFSAPWAMARMNHDGHAASAMGADPHASHSTIDGAHASTADTHHHGHASIANDAAGAPHQHDTSDSGDCCNGIACQCGCVLPPVVAIVECAALSLQIAQARFESLFAPLMERRFAPPLRPPNVA